MVTPRGKRFVQTGAKVIKEGASVVGKVANVMENLDKFFGLDESPPSDVDGNSIVDALEKLERKHERESTDGKSKQSPRALIAAPKPATKKPPRE